jgi:hypothetical protein
VADFEDFDRAGSGGIASVVLPVVPVLYEDPDLSAADRAQRLEVILLALGFSQDGLHGEVPPLAGLFLINNL